MARWRGSGAGARAALLGAEPEPLAALLASEMERRVGGQGSRKAWLGRRPRAAESEFKELEPLEPEPQRQR